MTNEVIGTKAKINLLRLLIERGKLPEAEILLKDKINFDHFPASRAKIYAQINLIKSISCLQQKKSNEEFLKNHDNLIEDLKQVIAEAEELKDNYAISYALGNLGGLYEYLGKENLKLAQALTYKALLLAEPLKAPEIAYQWQWQLGRLLEAQNQDTSVIKEAYKKALITLESVRDNLLTISSDVQFSFRDNVEPVYRKYMSLLLPRKTEPGNDINQEDTKEAVKQIENLQLAELQNFFQCRLGGESVKINQVQDNNTAIIYTLILENRLEVILQLPSKKDPLIRSSIVIQSSDLEKTLGKLRFELVNQVSGKEVYLPLAQEVYGWLIEPIEKYLKKQTIKTLVFVLDGPLRNIPVSALYDSKQSSFLIEKYAVAITPGTQILGSNNLRQKLKQKYLKALIAGLTTESSITIEGEKQYFHAIQEVDQELKKVQRVLNSLKPIEGKEFTIETLRQKLQSSSYPIIHLATHGQFSSDPRKTFIVTAGNQFIDTNELQQLVKSGKQSRNDAIELLVLSACETANGDHRATLGMAGVALKAGAGSTIATLWAVKNDSTPLLVEQFYQNFAQGIKQKKVTKAEALRQAQLSLLDDYRYSHPFFWSPFILIGNWL